MPYRAIQFTGSPPFARVTHLLRRNLKGHMADLLDPRQAKDRLKICMTLRDSWKVVVQHAGEKTPVYSMMSNSDANFSHHI